MLPPFPNGLRHFIQGRCAHFLLLQKATTGVGENHWGFVQCHAPYCEEPEHGPYTRAFYDYFLSIDIRNGEQLHDAVLRSQTFQQWKEQNAGRLDEDMTRKDLANLFLDEVHLTHYDIKKVIDGRELWEKDSGDLEDKDAQNEEENGERRPLDRMADYSDLSLEELLQRMEEVMKQQNREHSGGSHWVGTGGISPNGHVGAAKDGLRVGGSGGGKTALKDMGDAN